MSDIAIRVENLGKKYRLGVTHQGTLREALHSLGRRLFSAGRRELVAGSTSVSGSISSLPALSSPLSAPEPTLPAPRSDFWALRDIAFDVKRGEVLGVIGRNGAGKSTLLKILSRVTRPTTGRATIHGRVGSLLEVGTGFHPELTGRENVYLNGAILGMSKHEIDRKYDEIVDFAGVEQFMDTPVKRFSSGMHVRLGFAVAAHLEPEVLIVDEVLSVGDAEFQKRCVGRMRDVAKGGRTVLFVSHNMPAVNNLCSRVILLKDGHVELEGDTRTVSDRYLQSGAGDGSTVPERRWDLPAAPGDEVTRIKAFRVVNELGAAAYDHDIGNPLALEVYFWLLKPHDDISCSFHLYNQEGTCLFVTGIPFVPVDAECRLRPGLYRGASHIPADFLNDGVHSASAFVIQHKTRCPAQVQRAISFRMHDYGHLRGGYLGKVIGAIRPKLPFTASRLGDVS